MGLRHKVYINVTHQDGSKNPVIRSGTMQIRSRLLDFLFGEKVGVIVLTPGNTVETVEIKEIKERGEFNE